MTDLEKKRFFRSFIEDIHLFPDKKADECIIKQIDFKFPIYYDGGKRKGYFLLNESPVETVVYLKAELDA